jgi:HSP20 family molecular chaperone IbpA
MRQQSIQPGQPEAGLPVKVVLVQNRSEQKNKLHNLIECCAYELYEARGGDQGHAVEDWRNAELKVLCAEGQCPLGYIEQENEVDVDAAVEDFNAEELEVCVGPGCVSVSGCHNRLKCDDCGHSVGDPHPIFGALDLPVEVDAAKVTATLKRGMLHVVMPKSHPGRSGAGSEPCAA